jgi:hypothetical protein
MDTILYNGVIHTMAGPDASALAIQNGRLALVGSDRAALALKTADTTVIDLAGRCVLPGFVDSHMHLVITGIAFAQLDLRGVRSLDEIVERGRAFLAKNDLEPGEWVLGYGFDHNLFDPPVLPDRTVADAISTDRPVLLDRVCGHVGAANGPALALAGYDEATVIPGGHLEKDENGRLTGVLHEAALDRIKHVVPRLGKERVLRILRDMGGRMAAAGLTGVHSDDVGPEGTTWEALKWAVEQLEAEDACPLRIWEEWEAPSVQALEADVLSQPLRSFQGSDFLKVCNIKLISDGSLGARSALLRADYSDEPGNRGIAVYTQEALDELVAACHREDLQVACHAIGDGACEMFVNAVEKAMQADPKPLRHRVVHCQFGDEALYRRMASLGVGADIQPPFVPTDAPVTPARMGERTAESYAWKTLLDLGVRLGGGSDSPVEPFEPLWGIHCAVNRPGAHGDDAPFLPDQRLTVEEAVALYTTGPAALAGAERDLGTLEAGKLADLVVLDRDLFAVPAEEIRDIRVVMTMVGGRITFDGR